VTGQADPLWVGIDVLPLRRPYKFPRVHIAVTDGTHPYPVENGWVDTLMPVPHRVAAGPALVYLS